MIKINTNEVIRKTDDQGRGKMGKHSDPFTKNMYCFLILVGITGNVLYAVEKRPAMVILGRVLAGIGAGGAILTHKFVEYSTGGDEVMVRSRFVMLGAVQCVGAVLGVVLAVACAALKDVDVLGLKSASQQPLAAMAIAALYLILLPGIYSTYDSLLPPASVIALVDQTKGELDAPACNFLSAQRFGVLVPAVIQDRGQAQPSSLPDVFSTTVVIVVYFLMNNLLVGIEVAHGPFCVDLFKWGAFDISVTYLAFLVAGCVGLLLCVSLTDDVPCNRRLFGACVMMFVTYGLMLQPSTPKEQYIAFLVIIGCCYYIGDLSLTEIHVDKIGEDDDKRVTAATKLMIMGYLNTTATVTRILSAIITGYIYDYWSQKNEVSRRPYAVYGCGFGVALLLVTMCVIFYKRFQFRSLENQIITPDKMPLQPQVVNCIVEF